MNNSSAKKKVRPQRENVDDSDLDNFTDHYKQEILRLKQVYMENERYMLDQAQKISGKLKRSST